MNSPLAYLNGRFLPFAEAQLPLHDAGFVSGATVVDNARTFRHKLFRWNDHLARFRRDCEVCYVPLDATAAQLTAAAEELIAHNAALLPPGGELQLVTFATPGPLGFYLGEPANGPPTLGMVTYPLPFARYSHFFTDGASLAAVGGAARHAGVLSPTAKHRSRMLWHVADHKARERTGNPAALALLSDGNAVTETAVANFLAVVDGVVISPRPDTVLDGISLRVTRGVCRSSGVPFAFVPVGHADLERASEALLTGTGFCLAPVREIHGEWRREALRFSVLGPVFAKLLAAWNDLVGLDIAKQFTDAPG